MSAILCCIDGLTARKARKNNRRAAGLDAAAARLEGARPGSSVRHEYDELSLNTTNGDYHEFEYTGP